MSIAIARPELVKSLGLVGANYHYSGTLIHLPFVEPSEEDKAEYATTSPDAPHTQAEKIKKMLRIWDTEPDIALSDLAKIQCPTLIIAGDDDVISHEHTLDMYRAIELSQLAIMPGTSHIAPKEKPGLFSALVQQFLTDLNYPITKMPIRRVSNQPEEKFRSQHRKSHQPQSRHHAVMDRRGYGLHRLQAHLLDRALCEIPRPVYQLQTSHRSAHGYLPHHRGPLRNQCVALPKYDRHLKDR